MHTNEQNVVLLGDSIFDNAVYVPGELPIADQLRQSLPDGWRVSLLAIDGDGIDGVQTQLEDLPDDATFLIVSAGGNDALRYIDVFEMETDSVGGGLLELHDIQNEFSARYESMLSSVLERQLPTLVCTVYDRVPFADEIMRRLVQTSLSLFNDAILRAAAEGGISALELRALCTEISDYSHLSPIEPSAAGGAKIASAIARIVTEEDLDTGTGRIFVD